MRGVIFLLVFCVLEISAWTNTYFTETNLVKLAKIRAEREIEETRRINDRNYKPRPDVCPCSFDVFNIVLNKELPTTRNIINTALLRIETLKKLKELTGLSVDELTNNPKWIKAWESTFMCDLSKPPSCDPNARYRTFDGSCNNLRNPLLGTPFQPQSRFLAPEYVGDIDLPRTRSLQNQKLPNVRATSNIMNSDNKSTCLDDETVAVLSWGALVVTDTSETPSTSTDHRDRPFTCCGEPARAECFNINVNDDDPFFNVTCLDFVRASPTLANLCRPGRRQQINQLNSYLDASQIYGLSQADNFKIRVFKGGLLKVNKDNIPYKQQRPTADDLLTQTALFRLHNMYATYLSYINPHWRDERLFQETRRIISAVVQKITYDEYLTTFLNDETREKYCLTSSCSQYDDLEDPQIRVGFSVAAGRFGHSRTPPLPRFVNNFLRVLPGPTPPRVLEQLVNDILHEKAGCVDRFFEHLVHNELLKDRNGNSYDLLAIDLKRARDAAIPPYNRWREFCGLPKAITFTTGPGGLVDHTQEDVNILKKAYAKTEFIDLFTGGLSEKHLPGAKVGPTFSCILANQFRITKVADRYFWNRKWRNGFTNGQMKSIERNTLAKVLCEAYGRNIIQRDAFRIPSNRNPLVSCNALPGIDLNLWREKRRRYKE